MALSFPRKANTPELKSDIWAIVREEKPPDNARKCVAAPVAFTTGSYNAWSANSHPSANPPIARKAFAVHLLQYDQGIPRPIERGGKAMSTHRPKFRAAMVSLAFFFFLFLECTLYYQAAILSSPLSKDFLFVQLPILGASSAGYLSFPVYVRRVDRLSRRVLAVIFTAVGIACLAVEHINACAQTTFVAGFVSFYLLGIAGGGAFWAASVALSRNTFLATWVGICHAVGVTAQVILFALAPTRLLETIVLGVAIVAFVAFAMASWPSMKSARRLAADKALDYSYYDRKPFPFAGTGKTVRANIAPATFAIAFCVIVGLFAALFALLYNALPGNATWVSQYTDVSSRIALIAGGLVAGLFIDLGRVRHTGTAMLCAAFLATAAIFAGKAGVDEWVCRLAFFGGSGMFAIFYSASSMWIAPFMKIPQLWASIGRVVSNLTTIAVWLPALTLAKDADATMLALAAIALFAAITVLINAARMLILDDVGPNRFSGANDWVEGAVLENAQAVRAGSGEPCVGFVERAPGAASSGGSVPSTGNDSCEIALVDSADSEEDEQTAEALAQSSQADGDSASNCGVGDSEPPKTLSPEEQLGFFARKYSLTPRETAVLAAVMQDERPLKQIAADLDVTLRTVQRHLTSVYQKTNTQTRAGLAVRFFNETKEATNTDNGPGKATPPPTPSARE